MAKGKGKGQGKGHGDDDGSSCGGCCCLICCCILLPFIMFIVGIFILLAKNTRVERIQEYNTRAKEWMNGGLETYRNASFTVNGIATESVTTTSGSYYPVRDSCMKKNDPEEKCLLTDALYYKTYITASIMTAEVEIKSNDTKLISKKYKTEKKIVYSPSDLGCSKDTSKCSSKCSSRDGTWSSYDRTCTVTKYLVGFCFRVNKVKDIWQLDEPPAWPLSGSGVGCYYSNDYEEALYGKHRVEQLPVHIRYYKDSFISADEMTNGCSSSSTSSSSCFGMSQSEQNKTGAIVTVVGILLICIEIGGIVAMCLCCKDTIKGTFGKNKKESLINNQDIPYAQPAQPAQPSQPAYAQPVQPAYAQPAYAQPAYAQPVQPTQPNYGIPNYGQPNYGQPNYGQPNYGIPQN